MVCGIGVGGACKWQNIGPSIRFNLFASASINWLAHFYPIADCFFLFHLFTMLNKTLMMTPFSQRRFFSPLLLSPTPVIAFRSDTWTLRNDSISLLADSISLICYKCEWTLQMNSKLYHHDGKLGFDCFANRTKSNKEIRCWCCYKLQSNITWCSKFCSSNERFKWRGALRFTFVY